MLEAKLNLLIAMTNDKPKKEVKKVFTEYVRKYANIKNPMKNDVSDYKNTFLKYLDYMQRNEN